MCKPARKSSIEHSALGRTTSKAIIPACAILALLIATSNVAGQASFTAIGDLPGGQFYSGAYAVSGDGNTVVGFGYTGFSIFLDYEAVKWTVAGGMVPLGGLVAAPPYASGAYSVDRGGSVIVGDAPSSTLHQAFGWSGVCGMIGLGDLPGNPQYSQANRVSADGTMIVGYADVQGSLTASHAFKWTLATGMVGLPDLPGAGDICGAIGLSANGDVIVGFGTTVSGTEACYWTSGGVTSIGDLPGGPLYEYAADCSADGSVIAGYGTSANGREGFRWTAKTGMVGLGDLPGDPFASYALAISADGSVIVGTANYNDQIDYDADAFIWDAAHGMRELKQVLIDDGVDMTGWSLIFAWDVSDDGRVIVGEGMNPDGNIEGWVARLPAPCDADIAPTGGNGVINVDDLLKVINSWGVCP